MESVVKLYQGVAVASPVSSIIEDPTGKFFFSVMDEDATVTAVFEEFDLQGGGYTWEGIIEAMVDLHMPEARPELEIGAEADNAYVYSRRRELLETLAVLIGRACEDRALLLAAIEHAGEDLE